MDMFTGILSELQEQSKANGNETMKSVKYVDGIAMVPLTNYVEMVDLFTLAVDCATKCSELLKKIARKQ